MFPLLGVFMQDRGAHSWGYTDGVNIEKHVGPLTETYGPQYKGAKQAALHTRHATTGAHTAVNSHPWEFDGGLIGMHNGIVYNHRELNTEHGRRFEVDSMHIFQHIVEGRDLSEIEGYGAIVYWHEGKTWLGTFNGGTLCVARAPWGIVYASTGDAVADAFSMAGLPVPTYYKIEDGNLYFIKNGTLYLTETKLNISAGVVAAKWDDYKGFSDEDWKKWSAGGTTYDHKTIEDLTVQNDLPTLGSVSECFVCAEPFRKGDERWYTTDGWLCGYCATEHEGVATLEEPDDEKGLHEYTTTVADWLGFKAGDDPNEFTLACDGCEEQLACYQTVHVVCEDMSAEELYCKGCDEANKYAVTMRGVRAEAVN